MNISKTLNEINLFSFYEKHKNDPMSEWLEFHSTFKNPGKQGLVGLLKLKKEDIKCVFKISQYINYLVQHESVVMKGLNEISRYCPHFCKSIGVIKCKIDPKCRKEGNPFNSHVKYPIEKEVLLCEFIDKSCKFYNYIRAIEKVQEKILYSTIKQVLMSITIAQKKKKFTHYDLHSENIMMKRCNKDLVFLYVIDEENQFCVPTFGHYPIIIDFGFSYIEDMDDGPLLPSMGHTDVGFMSDRFDWVSDPKLFLVSVSDELGYKRKSKKSKKLRRIVENIFHPLKLDWESGWDNYDKKSASDYVSSMIDGYNENSKIFEKYECYCLDIIQSLVILPIEQQSYENIEVSYKTFLKEWLKIENEISSPFYNLYILKGIVDLARELRAYYMDSNTH